MRFRSALLLAAVLAGVPAHAAGDDPAHATYRRYCGACHGPTGKGDGVAASLMRPKPTDLTQIAKAHGGRFPFEQVRAAIDGTKEISAHGDAAMPVWGEIFRDEAAWDMSRRAEVRGKVLLVTEYVRSIQAR